MIEYRKGDLFAEEHPLIAHGVNCQGVMASGVAKIVKEKYPKAYGSYIEACEQRDQHDNLGRIRFCMDGKVQIAHCFTQLYFGRDEGIRYVSYDAVDDCTYKLNKFMTNWKIPYVAMPKIGAGLGNGKWEIIEAIINTNLKDQKVVVYVL